MAFDGFVTVNPSFVMPEIVMQITQKSGAFRTLAGGKQMATIGSNDQYVYAKTLQLRGVANAGQSAANQLDGPAFVSSMISTPTYLVRCRAVYDHHDVAAAGNWGVPLQDAYRRAVWQTIAQNERTALLYGFGGSGEGLLNASGATAVTLPADSNGNTTFRTYDNGEMGLFMLTQASALTTRIYQSMNENNRLVILGPQRILNAMRLANIVQLTQFQRSGAGTASTGKMIDAQFEEVAGTIEWCVDDTLIGKGSGGADAIVMVSPEIEDQAGDMFPDTNYFAGLMPGMKGCTLQLTDMPAPREIISPLAGGATDCLYEKRVTAGWAVRPEAITIISMAY